VGLKRRIINNRVIFFFNFFYLLCYFFWDFYTIFQDPWQHFGHKQTDADHAIPHLPPPYTGGQDGPETAPPPLFYRMISIGLFTFKMLPEVPEYCMEPPEKIALELENFYNLPYRGKPP